MFQFFARRGRGERGFTLIELLIVVAIIAILAAILIPNFMRARAQAQVSASKGNMKNTATALETYFVDFSQYPPSLPALTPSYLRLLPIDACLPPGANSFVYSTATSSASFVLQTLSWANVQCAQVARGISYTPDAGLVTY